MPQFCNFEFNARVAKVNGAALWSLAEAPRTPKKCRHRYISPDEQFDAHTDRRLPCRWRMDFRLGTFGQSPPTIAAGPGESLTALWYPAKFLGSIFNWCLFGVLVVQTLYCVFIAEQLQTVVVTQAVWDGLCGSSIAVTVQYTLLGRDLTKAREFYVAATTWLGASLVCDFTIAVTMLYLLIRAKLQSSLRSTETLVNRLIVSTIETGTATAAVTCLELVFYLKFPDTALYLMQYSNVFLATLNGRRNATPAAIQSSRWASRLQTITGLDDNEGSLSQIEEVSMIGIYQPPEHMQNIVARGDQYDPRPKLATC
ncbi:hypothetical protein BD779DRAFT_1474237 [Infundibulicybe gibba]|nr:hypothetical protein BD779DRAFT_1474237 [Infundibulicybe gibba]